MADEHLEYHYETSDEKYLPFEINGEEYRVRKFDARTGLKAARVLMKVIGRNGEIPEGNKLLGAMMVRLSDEEIDKLYGYAMHACEKRLKAGWTPVMDESGHYQIPEMETDSAATLLILLNALKFGVVGFFSVLSSALK